MTVVNINAIFFSYVYRDVPMAMKRDIIGAEVLGGFMWWWIFWHAWHYWGHIVVSKIQILWYFVRKYLVLTHWTLPCFIQGEYEYPDPLLWTDEELGIPPEED